MVVSRVDDTVVIIRINVTFEDSACGKSFTQSISFGLCCYYLEYTYVDSYDAGNFGYVSVFKRVKAP